MHEFEGDSIWSEGISFLIEYKMEVVDFDSS